ncbi:hypothetical protein LNQ03_11665 [Klebsiella pneumoniae subsp. pneumoniae]|nr:hypothetical protein [Klebsiella pneumoniae subsp. pneumoniae]
MLKVRPRQRRQDLGRAGRQRGARRAKAMKWSPGWCLTKRRRPRSRPAARQLNDNAGAGSVVHYEPSNVLLMTGRAAVIKRLLTIVERVDNAGDRSVVTVPPLLGLRRGSGQTGYRA